MNPQQKVDPVIIHSVYCTTAESCVRVALSLVYDEYKKFIGTQLIELPADEKIYNEAVSMLNKFSEERLITLPVENVRKGFYTLRQAIRIANSKKFPMIKETTIEGHGVILCTIPMGLSAVVTTALALYQQKTVADAVEQGLFCMIELGGKKMVEYLASKAEKQLSLKEALKKVENIKEIDSAQKMTSPEGLMQNKKEATVNRILKATHDGLKTNILVAVSTAVDLVELSKDKKSSVQITKNAIDSTAGVSGGVAGFFMGSILGSFLFPGLGSIVGGVVGGVIGGTTAGTVSTKVTNKFIKTDKQIFERFVKDILEPQFHQLAIEFLLIEEEISELVKEVGKMLIKQKTGVSIQKLRSCFSSKQNRFSKVETINSYAQELLIPYFEDTIAKRKEVDVKLFVSLI